ncbi:MAG: epoxyqueuosine reductase [Deltaproteobacteria bacterium]|nr:epoxyqueuosine reductase [Deltaproteobacteria bacterium]MBW2050927.1 epoxyqueuosine reductase [Deltaproteobacteria bacterium]MBW2141182.1 epoxyqueuosine reductase [Deltaproteobacteria bacterium]MBW2323700.1 epoxyqueuosine reductase [Deltaproteobacteria bacterium]
MSLAEKIKDHVLDLGADFAGIASHTRFEGAPPFSEPKNLLPGFRSVIAFGIAMNRGALEAWFSKRNRRPQVLQDRLATGELDKISLHLSRYLERQGYKTLFISQNGYYNALRGRPDFSHKHAAMAAGLGMLGLSSNFVHSKHGAAVHLASVITEAELEPDPLLTDEENPCTGCKTCLQICPEQAMNKDIKAYFMMEGKEFSHQKLNGLRCAWGCAGLSGHHYKIGNREVGTWSYNDIPRPTDRREFYSKFQEADRFLRHPKELAEMLITNGTEYCGNCLKVCVGSKKETAALFELHLNSGIAEIPDDPSLILNLTTANNALEKYHIPTEEIEALIQSSNLEVA